MANTITHAGAPVGESPLTSGGIRLLQAYLRMLGYFGDPSTVRGVDVVDGNYGARTQAAVAQFARSTHSPHAHPCDALLNEVRSTYLRNISRTRSQGSPWAVLDHAFRENHPSGGALWSHLHPAMRFPLLAAVEDLRRQGVAVSLMDGRRSPREQETHIREGRSTAPPGASFHDYGLAIDIVPRHDSANPANPDWNRIHNTMQRYGFYSLFRAQGWDRPHFELPASTAAMMAWGLDAQGWKQIPASHMPAAWQRINTRSLAQLSAVDPDEILMPPQTPPRSAARGVQRA